MTTASALRQLGSMRVGEVRRPGVDLGLVPALRRGSRAAARRDTRRSAGRPFVEADDPHPPDRPSQRARARLRRLRSAGLGLRLLPRERCARSASGSLRTVRPRPGACRRSCGRRARSRARSRRSAAIEPSPSASSCVWSISPLCRSLASGAGAGACCSGAGACCLRAPAATASRTGSAPPAAQRSAVAGAAASAESDDQRDDPDQTGHAPSVAARASGCDRSGSR